MHSILQLLVLTTMIPFVDAALTYVGCYEGPLAGSQTSTSFYAIASATKCVQSCIKNETAYSSLSPAYPEAKYSIACACNDGCSLLGPGKTALQVDDSLCSMFKCGLDRQRCGGYTGNSVYHAVYVANSNAANSVTSSCHGVDLVKRQSSTTIYCLDKAFVLNDCVCGSTSCTSGMFCNNGVCTTTNTITYQNPLNFATWTIIAGGSTLNPTEFRAISNNNGVIELFAIAGVTSTVYRSVQSGNNFGVWTAFGSLSYTKALNVVKMPDGRVQVFLIGSDYAVWYSVQASAGSSTYSAFTSIGGSLLNINVVSDQRGSLRILGLGSGNWLYQAAQTNPNTNTWSEFTLLTNNLQTVNGWSTQLQTASLTTAMNADGRYVVFGLGMGGSANGQVLYLLQSAPNSETVLPWATISFPGGSFKSISVLSTNSQKLVLFGLDSANNAWFLQQSEIASTTWGTWTSIGAKLSTITTTMGDQGVIGMYGCVLGANQTALSQVQKAAGDYSMAGSTIQNIGGGNFTRITSTRAADGTAVIFAGAVNGTLAVYWAGTQLASCAAGSNALTARCSCQGRFCDSGQFCARGSCMSTCGVSSTTPLTSPCMCGTSSCSAGFNCVNNACIPTCTNSSTSFIGSTCLCGGTVCPFGNSVCHSNVCTIVPNDCLSVSNLFP
ncbi:hypothetical protein BDR26DRAFT_922962, partial [Obelidium mucronatum]